MKTMAIALVSALSVALAPTAWADDDADFIRALERSGFVFDGGGRTNMVALGIGSAMTWIRVFLW